MPKLNLDPTSHLKGKGGEQIRSTFRTLAEETLTFLVGGAKKLKDGEIEEQLGVLDYIIPENYLTRLFIRIVGYVSELRLIYRVTSLPLIYLFIGLPMVASYLAKWTVGISLFILSLPVLGLVQARKNYVNKKEFTEAAQKIGALKVQQSAGASKIERFPGALKIQLYKHKLEESPRSKRTCTLRDIRNQKTIYSASRYRGSEISAYRKFFDDQRYTTQVLEDGTDIYIGFQKITGLNRREPFYIKVDADSADGLREALKINIFRMRQDLQEKNQLEKLMTCLARFELKGQSTVSMMENLENKPEVIKESSGATAPKQKEPVDQGVPSKKLVDRLKKIKVTPDKSKGQQDTGVKTGQKPN